MQLPRALLKDGSAVVFGAIEWRRDFPWFAALGLLGVTGNHLTLSLGAFLSSATDGLYLQPVSAVLTVAIAIGLKRESAARLKLVGIAAGVAGALLIVTARAPAVGVEPSRRLLGFVCFFGNNICWSSYLNLQKDVIARFPTATLIFWSFVFGGTVNISVGAAYTHSVTWSDIGTNSWLSIAYIVVCGTVGAFFCMSYAVKHLPSSVSGIAICLQPLFATLLTGAILDETITLMHAVGGLVICFAVGIVVYARSEEEEINAIAARAARAASAEMVEWQQAEEAIATAAAAQSVSIQRISVKEVYGDDFACAPSSGLVSSPLPQRVLSLEARPLPGDSAPAPQRHSILGTLQAIHQPRSASQPTLPQPPPGLQPPHSSRKRAPSSVAKRRLHGSALPLSETGNGAAVHDYVVMGADGTVHVQSFAAQEHLELQINMLEQNIAGVMNAADCVALATPRGPSMMIPFKSPV
jgi:drug/metabolite transporter (DMT)-like permease